jgi:DNA-binding CsgD family transcriptional regulator
MTVSARDLPEREKQVLRLLLTGHDAKNIGRALGLSTNVVNERLRDSRRKLGVGSSREAARALALVESATPNILGNKPFGIAPQTIQPEKAPTTSFQKGLIVTTISAIFLAGAALFYAASSAPVGPPTVISTIPADGSIVPAGPYVLKVTYDRPMAPRSFSFVQASADSYPLCDNKPKQSADGRSFTMACKAKPNGRYEIWFNRGRFMNFKSKDGLVPASPKRLIFRTQ